MKTAANETLYCDTCRKFDRELPQTFSEFHRIDGHPHYPNGWVMCDPCFKLAIERENRAEVA